METRRLLIAALLSMAVLLLWQKFFPAPEPAAAPPTQPATVEPVAAPSPTPAQVEVSTPEADVSAMDQLRLMEPAVEATMRQKGLITGDHGGLDRTHGRARVLLRRGKFTEAVETAERALGFARSLSIDRRFVETKLGRLNKRFAKINDPAQRKRLEGLIEVTARSFGAENYTVTNRHLNRAFALLQRAAD